MFDQITHGKTVTILVPAGFGRHGQEYKEASGRAVMRGPHGWALNMAGRYGTPGVCTPDNFVRLGRAKNKPGFFPKTCIGRIAHRTSPDGVACWVPTRCDGCTVPKLKCVAGYAQVYIRHL